MNRIAIRGLRERKARTIFTLLAVVLGVALISGTFVLTDTISKSFDKLVATAGENVDVKVLSRNTATGSAPRPRRSRRPSRRRCALSTASPPPTARSVSCLSPSPTTAASASGRSTARRRSPSRPSRSASTPSSTRAARRERTARSRSRRRRPQDAGLKIGDRIRIQGTQRIRPYTLVGTTTFGGAGSHGRRGVRRADPAGGPDARRGARQDHRSRRAGAARRHAVRAQAAHQRAGRAGRSSCARARRTPGRSPRTSSEILGYLRIGLLVFGLIALLVGSFVIFNTFTITVAQRTREFGMLRTIGASRRQILQAVVLEALLIGLVGSVLGLFAGIGLAPLLAGLLGLIGFDLPRTALVVAGRTVAVAIVAGHRRDAAVEPGARAARHPDLADGRDARGLARLVEGQAPLGAGAAGRGGRDSASSSCSSGCSAASTRRPR